MRNHHPVHTVVLSALLVGLFLPAAAGARSRRVPLPELATKSARVSVVTCRAATVIRRGPKALPFTVYHLTAEQTVHGPDGAGDLVLRVVGGTVGRYRVVVHDAPRFEPGRHYVVFLKTAPRDGGLLVSGGAQGILPARRSADGKSWEVDLGASPAAKRAGGITDTGSAWVPLDRFRSLLSEGGAQ